jgi:hypothetical protein
MAYDPVITFSSRTATLDHLNNWQIGDEALMYQVFSNTDQYVPQARTRTHTPSCA